MEVDEATLSWNRLEYARFQVRALKSRKAKLAKGFQIKVSMYNVTIVEEVNYYDGEDNKCKCAYNHEGSSDSIWSFESFVEDSLFSAKLSNEERGEEGGSYWWPEKSKGEGRGWSTEKTKKGLEGEYEEDLQTYQQKSAPLFTRKGMSPQGVSMERTTVSVIQQVNVVCEAIQNSLANLVEVVESFSSLSVRPNLNEAQFKESGSKAQLCTSAGCVSGLGTPLGGICVSVHDVGQSLTLEIARAVQSMSNGSKGISSPPLRLKDSHTDPTNRLNLVMVEGSGGNTGKKKIDIGSGGEDSIAVNAYQTAERVRHMHQLWEQGARTVQQRWRSKGGLGSLHYGNKYSTRSSSNSYALSDSEIVESNNRIRKECVESESTRIWNFGKRLGATSSQDEDIMFKEMEILEDRDRKVLSKSKKGTKSGCI